MTNPFKADVLVVKLSGKALTADKALDALFAALAGSAASAERTRVVLVHGGGVEVDALMRGLGRPIDRIEGLRVSPAEDMPVIAGALAGTCSLKLRGAAQRAGLMPLGLCATDAGIGRVVPADPRLGRVGVIEPGDSAAKRRLQAGYFVRRHGCCRGALEHKCRRCGGGISCALGGAAHFSLGCSWRARCQ